MPSQQGLQAGAASASGKDDSLDISLESGRHFDETTPVKAKAAVISWTNIVVVSDRIH
jgi:hypothetical protein